MMSLYRISYAAPSVWNSLPCDINYIQSPTAFKAALKTLLFNPFTAWPRRFLGHTVHAICPGLENFQVIGKVYFQFCSCREATLAGIHMAARLTSHMFFLYGGLRAYFSTIFFGGWEWGWGGGGWCHFWVMATDQRKYCLHLAAREILNEVLNDASNDDETLYNSEERHGNSGEEEDGDIFPK